MQTQKRKTVNRLSLRDPSGQLFDVNGRLIRYVNCQGRPHLEATLGSTSVKKFMGTNQFIESKVVGKKEQKLLGDHKTAWDVTSDGLYLEHPRVSFVSYPHEWPAEMLYEAAKLTLDLAHELLEEGMGIKDATPLNVLFNGPNPVFVDVLSVEKRDENDPSWVAYAQFVRTFLNPLLVNKHFGLALEMIYLTHRDGLEPEEVYKMCGPVQRLTRPFFSLVSVPTWLGRKKKRYSSKEYEKKLVDHPEKAKFILGTFYKHLRKNLEALRPASIKSTWSDYMGDDLPYSKEEFSQKDVLLDELLEKCKAKSVLDVGCNTGHFSAKAAKKGAKVVAIDYDPVVVGKTWQRAKSEGLDILPLRVDLTRPTPGVGWKNSEGKSFLERAQGKFDTVMMLAVVHHMMVSEGIPLEEVVELVSQITTKNLIIEYIDPKDPTFKEIARGRDELYKYLTPEVFEKAFKKRFRTIKGYNLHRPTRRLYYLKT